MPDWSRGYRKQRLAPKIRLLLLLSKYSLLRLQTKQLSKSGRHSSATIKRPSAHLQNTGADPEALSVTHHALVAIATCVQAAVVEPKATDTPTCLPAWSLYIILRNQDIRLRPNIYPLLSPLHLNTNVFVNLRHSTISA